LIGHTPPHWPVRVFEATRLEEKFYFAGVGNVLTVDLVTGERSELVSFTTGN
jgi:hypothetical protein